MTFKFQTALINIEQNANAILAINDLSDDNILLLKNHLSNIITNLYLIQYHSTNADIKDLSNRTVQQYFHNEKDDSRLRGLAKNLNEVTVKLFDENGFNYLPNTTIDKSTVSQQGLLLQLNDESLQPELELFFTLLGRLHKDCAQTKKTQQPSLAPLQSALSLENANNAILTAAFTTVNQTLQAYQGDKNLYRETFKALLDSCPMIKRDISQMAKVRSAYQHSSVSIFASRSQATTPTKTLLDANETPLIYESNPIGDGDCFFAATFMEPDSIQEIQLAKTQAAQLRQDKISELIKKCDAPETSAEYCKLVAPEIAHFFHANFVIPNAENQDEYQTYSSFYEANESSALNWSDIWNKHTTLNEAKENLTTLIYQINDELETNYGDANSILSFFENPRNVSIKQNNLALYQTFNELLTQYVNKEHDDQYEQTLSNFRRTFGLNTISDATELLDKLQNAQDYFNKADANIVIPTKIQELTAAMKVVNEAEKALVAACSDKAVVTKYLQERYLKNRGWLKLDQGFYDTQRPKATTTIDALATAANIRVRIYTVANDTLKLHHETPNKSAASQKDILYSGGIHFDWLVRPVQTTQAVNSPIKSTGEAEPPLQAIDYDNFLQQLHPLQAFAPQHEKLQDEKAASSNYRLLEQTQPSGFRKLAKQFNWWWKGVRNVGFFQDKEGINHIGYRKTSLLVYAKGFFHAAFWSSVVNGPILAANLGVGIKLTQDMWLPEGYDQTRMAVNNFIMQTLTTTFLVWALYFVLLYTRYVANSFQGGAVNRVGFYRPGEQEEVEAGTQANSESYYSHVGESTDEEDNPLLNAQKIV